MAQASQGRNEERKFIPNLRVNRGTIRGRNFSGNATPYTPEGQRSFLLILTEDQAAELDAQGWTVKRFKPAPGEEEPGDPFLKVKLRFDRYPPRIYLVNTKVKRELDDKTVSILDFAEIDFVDAVITPYQWTMGTKPENMKSGVTAYLKVLYATVKEDELEARYRNIPDENAIDAMLEDDD